MRVRGFVSMLCGGGMALAVMASAHGAGVASYDISNTLPSGAGGWSHVYDGAIACDDNTGLCNYSGGSGTLNDGVIPTQITDNQLFYRATGPVITLRLDTLSHVNSVQIYGGNPDASSAPSSLSGDFIPGSLTGWSVTIGGQTLALSSVAFGLDCQSGRCDDRVELAGTGLDRLPTDTVILSAFQGGFLTQVEAGPGFYVFNIGEVGVDSVAVVPEPATYALMLAGLMAVIAAVRVSPSRPRT